MQNADDGDRNRDRLKSGVLQQLPKMERLKFKARLRISHDKGLTIV
jgi:hypothetical protein